MRRFSLAVLASALFALLAVTTAQAQATRTWVSGVGDDANPCSRTAPCKTFAGAISKTAAAGMINCIDPGGFGAVTIVKSITIDCEGTQGGIVVAGTNGIIINAQPTDKVYLRNLSIEGTIAVPGLNGIRIIAGGFVQIEDCRIHVFTSATPNGAGILVQAPNVNFVVARVTFFDNANGAIVVKPTSGTAVGTIDRVIAHDSNIGIVADTTGGAVAINLTVRDSSFHRNATAGFSATTSGGAIGIMTMRNSVVGSNLAFTTSGANATIRVGESMITGNGSAASGAVFSYGTNQIAGNGNDNMALIPAPALK